MLFEIGELGDFISFQNGYGFLSEDFSDHQSGDSIDVFKMGNLRKGGGLNPKGTKSWISRKDIVGLERFIIKKHDLLMCMTDMKESIGLLGNTALMNVDNRYILNQRVGLLRALNKKGVGKNFLYALTNSEAFLRDLRRRANIGVQVNLTSPEILATKFPLAPSAINSELEGLLEGLYTRVSLIFSANEAQEKAKTLILQKISTIAA